MQKIGNYDKKINVIPKGMKRKKMVHVTKNLIFIYSMQFINSSLENLGKNYRNKNFNLNICFKKFFENNLKK